MSILNLIKKIKPSGLRSQLILGIVLINVFLMSFFVIELMNRQKTFFLNLNSDRASGLSANLASTANSYVISYELARLQKLVSTFKSISGLEYAMVISDDGTVLAHTNEKFLGMKATDSISAKLKPIMATQILKEDNSIFDIAAPIINNNQIIGWARIGLSQKYIEPNLIEIRNKGLFYILISIIVGSIFALIVAGSLSKGLQKLITASEKIKDGARDLRVGHLASNELNHLGTAFNQMLDDISANEKLLNMVLENMPVGVFILDAQGKVVSLNPAAQQIWEGAKYVEFDEYHVYKGWFPNGKEIESHEWGAAVALKENRVVLNQEAEIEGFDGTRKTILNSCIPMHDANEKTAGVISINVDITDRKQAENELRKRNHDIGERIKELNGLYKMSQLSNDPHKTMKDILKDCVDIIPPAYQYPEITCARIEFETEIVESEDFEQTIWKQEQNIIGRNKIIGKVQVYYKEQRPEETEGPFMAEERLLINSIADILGSSAERRRSQEELTKSEEKNRALIENISDGIVLLDENKNIVYQSSSVERINGYSFEERDDKSAEALIYHPDKPAFKEFLRKVYNAPGIPLQSQFRMLHKDGHVMWIEGSMINMLRNNSIKGIIVNYRDVTTQKKVTELFKHQFENSPDIILVINKDFKIESINRARPGGPSVTELIGMSSIDVLPEESKQMAKEAILKCFETGQNLEIENSLHSNKWVRSRFVPIIIDGMINHIMIIATDITERKIAEENLKQSEERNRALIENISDGIILINEDGNITYQSPSVERIVGYTLEDRKDKSVLDFILEEDIITCRNQHEESLQKPGIPIQNQFRSRHKNGHYIWLETFLMNLLDNKSVQSFVAVYRDITERKQFEEHQRLFASIVNSSDDAIVSTSLDGEITSWNHGAEKVLGYSEAEMIGNPITLIIPSDRINDHHEITDKIKIGQSVDHYETQRKKKNGELIYVSLTVSPIMDSNGMVNGSSKILRDITHQKLMELEREKMINEMVQRNRDLEQFSFIVSHNIRSPISTLLGLTSMMEYELSEDEKEALVKGIKQSATKLDTVIRDVNDILNVKKELLQSKVNIKLNLLVNSVMGDIQGMINKSSAKIDVDFSAIDSVNTVSPYLYSIFLNLISNGIKYAKLEVAPEIKIWTEKKEDLIFIYFSDNGIGIDLKKNKEHIFGLYKRFNLEIEGKGMGLFMVKTQVAALNGTIEVESEPGVGTTFKIMLPA